VDQSSDGSPKKHSKDVYQVGDKLLLTSAHKPGTAFKSPS